MSNNQEKIAHLDELVWLWAMERGIPSNATPIAQLTKTSEEVGETIRAALKYEAEFEKLQNSNKPEDDETYYNIRKELRSEFGDILVTWIIAAGMYNLTMEECLQEAYDKIKHRTGRMINGVWVKDAP